jgi:hypothetical protein
MDFFSVERRVHKLFPSGWSGITIHQISASHVAKIIRACHHTQLFVEMGISETFCDHKLPSS